MERSPEFNLEVSSLPCLEVMLPPQVHWTSSWARHLDDARDEEKLSRTGCPLVTKSRGLPWTFADFLPHGHIPLEPFLRVELPMINRGESRIVSDRRCGCRGCAWRDRADRRSARFSKALGPGICFEIHGR